MNSTLMTKSKSLLRTFITIAVWCALWQLAAMVVGREYFLPDIPTTLTALGGLLTNFSFYRAVFMSLVRVFVGLLCGVAFGIALAVVSNRFKSIYAFVSPMISVIKATPVASFIVILWIAMNGDALTVFIAFLMVMPIIWQNLIDGYDAIDRQLDEVCTVFEFSYFKRLKLLVLPTLIKFLIPGIITSIGLAWKSTVAAEIIVYTKNSIGGNISDAKYFSDTPSVFAWTLVVILLSIFFEQLTKKILSRYKK